MPTGTKTTRTGAAGACAVLLALAAVWFGAGCAARRPAALPPPAPEALDRWERVLALPPGSSVRVRLRSDAVVEGRLRSVDAERIVVEGRGAAGTPRGAVRTVSLTTRRVVDFTWRGLAAGAAFGAAMTALAAGSSDALPVLPVVLWYGGLGAGGGALLGLTPIESIVYDARAGRGAGVQSRRRRSNIRGVIGSGRGTEGASGPAVVQPPPASPSSPPPLSAPRGSSGLRRPNACWAAYDVTRLKTAAASRYVHQEPSANTSSVRRTPMPMRPISTTIQKSVRIASSSARRGAARVRLPTYGLTPDRLSHERGAETRVGSVGRCILGRFPLVRTVNERESGVVRNVIGK